MRTSTLAIRAVTLLSLLIFFNQNLFAQDRPELRVASDESIYTLPVGTVIRVRMDNGLSSASASAGDTFTTVISESVIVRGVEIIPAGAVIEGSVLKASAARRGGAHGFIEVTFDRIRLPNGYIRDISADLTDPNAESALASSENRTVSTVSRSKTGDPTTANIGYIAGGAGAGILVGAATKGSGGAALGGALGAGAGMLFSYFRKGENAEIRSGDVVGVVLRKSVTMPARGF